MGIRLLNTFLRNKCYNVLTKQSLLHMSGKTIAVDTMIYMYRFKGEDNLIENFYTMLLLFKKYNINAYFVFDGEQIDNKDEERKVRRLEKKKATENVNKLQESIDTIMIDDIDDDKKKEIRNLEKKLKILKKDCIYINEKDIKSIKGLIKVCGFDYIKAHGEADEYCALLCKQRLADAVLTEDMDLVAYGCVNVMRYLSLRHETFVMYDIEKILCTLKLDFKTFRQMCVITGTDYNPTYKNNPSNNIFYLYGIIDEYYNSKNKNLFNHIYSDKTTQLELYNIEGNFRLGDKTIDNPPECVSNDINLEDIKEYLSSYNFY